MASAASLKEQDSITVITEGVGSGPGLKNSNNQYDRECLEKGGSGSLNMEQGKKLHLQSIAHFLSITNRSVLNSLFIHYNLLNFRNAHKKWKWRWMGRLSR